MNADDLNPAACLVALLDQTLCSGYAAQTRCWLLNCFVDHVECYELRIPSEQRTYPLTSVKEECYLFPASYFWDCIFSPLSDVPCHSLLPFLFPSSLGQTWAYVESLNSSSMCNLLILKSKTGNKMVNMLWVILNRGLKSFRVRFLQMLYSFLLLCITALMK